MTDPMEPVVSDSSSPVLRIFGVLLALAVVAGLAGGAILLVSAGGGGDGDSDRATSADEAPDEPDGDASEPADQGGEPSDEPAATTTVAPPTTAPAPLDLLRNDPRPAIDDWLASAGDAAVAVDVTLYENYGFLEVRDPDRPRLLQEYGWRDGEIEGPEATQPFPGTDLNAESYPMSAVNWDALPGLVARAPARAGIPRGEVTHVIVESDLPFENRFVFRIYVSGTINSDYVEATIDGRAVAR